MAAAQAAERPARDHLLEHRRHRRRPVGDRAGRHQVLLPAQPQTKNGGELSAGQTQGYGPERYQIAKAPPGRVHGDRPLLPRQPEPAGGETHVNVVVTQQRRHAAGGGRAAHRHPEEAQRAGRGVQGEVLRLSNRQGCLYDRERIIRLVGPGFGRRTARNRARCNHTGDVDERHDDSDRNDVVGDDRAGHRDAGPDRA